MNDQFKKYIEEAQKVSMSATEKQNIWNFLETITDAPVAPQSTFTLIKSPYIYFIARQKVLVLTILALFIVTFGTSFASEKSLPGDLLYPFKIKVTEKVAGFFATTPQARASHEAQIAINRVEEAEILGAEGRLDSSTQADLQDDFTAHVENIHALIITAPKGGADIVAQDLHNKLEIHKNILAEIAKNGSTGDSSDLNALAAHIELVINSKGTATADADPLISSGAEINASSSIWTIFQFSAVNEDSARTRIDRNDRRISDLENILRSGKAGEAATLKVKNQITLATNLQSEAKIKLNEGNFEEAFSIASKATEILGNSHKYLETQIQIKPIEKIINIKTGRPLKVQELDDVSTNAEPPNVNTNNDSSKAAPGGGASSVKEFNVSNTPNVSNLTKVEASLGAPAPAPVSVSIPPGPIPPGI